MRAPLRAAATEAGDANRFVGRLRTEERLAHAFDDGARVVSVVGVHGVGTSTCVQRTLAATPDGGDGAVACVPLRGVPVDRIAAEVARAATPDGDRPARIVVLDDVPGDETSRAAVRAALAAPPHADGPRWVVTGTAPLSVPDEVTIPLGGLTVAALGAEASERIDDAPTLRILHAAATAAGRSTAPHASERATWVRLAREVGGHPGALVQLGARVARDGTPMPAMGGGPTAFVRAAFGPDAAAVVPEWAALAPEARTVVRALAHLRAGGTADDVAALADVPVDAVRGRLLEARRRGLVRTTDDDRFAVSAETAAALRADASGDPDAAALADRHAAFVRRTVAALAGPGRDGPTGAASVAMLERLDDVEAALDHDVEHDPARALFVAGRTWPAYRRIGRAATLLRYVAVLLDAHGNDLSPGAQAAAFATRGSLETIAGRWTEAKASFEAALAIHAEGVDVTAEARVHLNLAQVEASLADLDAAEARLRRGRDLAEAHDLPWVAAACTGNLGHVLRGRGDRAGAAAAYREAIAALKPLNDAYSVAGLRIAALSVAASDGAPADVIREVHTLDLDLGSVDGVERRSLRRPFRAMRDAVAASGHAMAAELLDRIAREHHLG